MDIIVAPRQRGKTTKLLTWLRDNPEGVLLTFNYRRREILCKDNPEFAGRIFSVEEFLHNRPYMGMRVEVGELSLPLGEKVAFDDLDIFLSSYLGAYVELASVTGRVHGEEDF